MIIHPRLWFVSSDHSDRPVKLSLHTILILYFYDVIISATGECLTIPVACPVLLIWSFIHDLIAPAVNDTNVIVRISLQVTYDPDIIVSVTVWCDDVWYEEITQRFVAYQDVQTVIIETAFAILYSEVVYRTVLRVYQWVIDIDITDIIWWCPDITYAS